MTELRFAILGTGFWSRYQLAGWRELPGVRCVACYNRTRSKAEALARDFGVPAAYDNVESLLDQEDLDFVDVITDVGTHRQFVEQAVARQLPVICQKPLAPTLADAQAMLETCTKAKVSLLVNENWRWQSPIRALKNIIAAGEIGTVFRARIDYCNHFPVFENQPALKQESRFILADMGSHILDTARFLFGEAASIYCQTQRVHPEIRGEDVATVVLATVGGATVVCNLSYASYLEHDSFPQTFALIEGTNGSVELRPDYWIHVTTPEGTTTRQHPPTLYPWINPRYAVVHASIVECQRNLLQALRGEALAETTGLDNLKTMTLVSAAYQSAATKTIIPLNP